MQPPKRWVPFIWKYFGAFFHWSCFTAVCFWTVSFAVCIFERQPVLGLWQVMSSQHCADSPKQYYIQQISLCEHCRCTFISIQLFDNRKIFYSVCTLLSEKEFPKRFETNSNLGFSDPVCNLNYAYFKTTPVKHLASFFSWWDHPNTRSSPMACQTSSCINLNSI